MIKLILNIFKFWSGLYATPSRSIIVTPSSATTQTVKRHVVEDKIRDLFPASAVLMSLVSKGMVKAGDMVQQAGLLAKRSVTNKRFESYSYTPLGISTTTTGLSSTTLTVASSAAMTARGTLVNTANGTTARIDSITSATEIEITSFGSTAFSVTSGDTLLMLAPAYEEGSSSPNIIHKEEDNIYNVTQIMRFPVQISATRKNTASHVGDYWSRMKEIGFKEGKRKVENTLLFGNRPSSGNGTTGGSAYSSTFSSTRGVWNWAQNSFDCGGNMTPAKFRKDMVLAFSNQTINDDERMVMLCGGEIYGRMLEWVNEKLTAEQTSSGELKKFGLKARTLVTSGPDIDVIKHDALNRGSFATSALLFAPHNLFYAFLTGRDLKPNTDIGSPSLDGFEDEIIGEIGIGTFDGGESIMKLTNWY